MLGKKMSSLCTICVRSASKGVPGKNIRPIAGKPLLVHSIDQAKASGLFEAVAVSSDGPEILAVAERAGADYRIRRPEELAGDNAPKLPAIRHCVESVERETGHRFDVIVDLDATSPLRTVDDIVGAVSLLEKSSAENVITGAKARRSPYFNLVELSEDGVVHLSKPLDSPVGRRQDAPRCFDMNASIYVWRRSALFEGDSLFGGSTRLFEMPEERSLDIDSELDFQIVEFLLARNTEK